MSDASQRTILLVEDEVISAMAGKITLKNYGNKVLTAFSGEEAVETVEKTPAINLVLMDINLGAGIDGTEAAEIILKNRDLPVVFLSGHTEPAVVGKTEKITSYGYIVKNSSSTVLDASIKMAFKLFEAKTKEKEKESQREAALEALRESEEMFREMAEQLEDVLFKTDNYGTITYISPSASRVFGWLPGEMIGRNFVEFLLESEIPKAMQAFQATIYTGQPKRNLILSMKRRDNSVFFGELKGSPLDKKRSSTGTLGLIHDISERKRAEEESKRQLAEKVILLKEVHHRIKNNIASIAGLLSMQAQSVTNPEAGAVLHDAIGRVVSMQILYDQLLHTESYKDSSAKNYVEGIAASVVALFPGEAEVTIDQRIADFQLDAKQLSPLGIIINELLTNIMKHAFGGRKKGMIKISLARAGGRVTLTVRDNGRGLPDGFDLAKSTGLGLMLVKMLCQQLGGSFSIAADKGTRCTVIFDA